MLRPAYLPLLAMFLVAAAPPNKWEQAALSSAAPFIDRANNEWTEATVSGDADVMSAPYDENGVFVLPDGSSVRGKAAVRSMYAGRPKDVKVLKASIKSDGRAAPDPDDVYEWGTAQMVIQRDGGAAQSRSGRYLTVWHRSGAQWVITRNIAF